MGKKLTLSQFVERSKNIHNNKYDYTMSVYKNSNTKIKIICPIHGIFEQIGYAHLAGQGCPKCSGKIRKRKEDFILESNKIHSNKYDYSLVDYHNNKKEIKIICPIHGIFKQRPDSHLQGHGCDKCGGTKTLTTNEFITRSNKIHNNKYDYSLTTYELSHKKVKIICPIHGIFKQTPSEHLSDRGCPSCANKHLKTTDFIIRAKKKHGNKYDYSLVEYTGTQKKVKIICPTHGIFEQVAKNHTDGFGCSICNESHGEKEIRNLLEKNKILFETQKKFNKCRNKSMLPFDFYLPHYNMCIEYDGIQHFKPLDIYGGEEEFKKTKKRDKIKTNFCKNHKIKLLRIKYNQNIENKLFTYLKKYNNYNF